MSALPVPALTPDAARVLTDQVKSDAAALWAKLLGLYEGDAHTALGYSSWGAYYEAEFGAQPKTGYRLLEAARVLGSLSDMHVTPSQNAARELVPVLRDTPEEVPEVWGEVVELHGPTPTAAQVREVVESRGSCDVLPDGVEHISPGAFRETLTRGQLSNQSGGTDEWATPQDFYDVVNAEFGFDLDVCALDTSAKCERYFTPETDGLAHEWTGTVWMNPPYGDVIATWMRKAYESAQAGATVVCLVPARTDTGWFHDYCFPMEVRFIKGRLRFGEAEASAPFPSCLVVLGPNVGKRAFDWSWR